MSDTETGIPAPAESRKRRRSWGTLLLRVVIVALSGFVTLGVAAAMVINHTTAGRDFALDWALERVRPALNGTLRIGGVGPSGLLAGATLYDVELSDSMGRRVLVADSVRARYSIAGFFGGPPSITDLNIWSPVVHLEPEPGEPVSLSGLLAEVETQANAAAATGADGDESPIFRMRGARIHGGVVIMRDDTGAEERVEGIEADFSRVDIGPSEDLDLVAEVDELALSYPLGYGRLDLSGLRGEVEVGPDDILVRAERFRLPGSEARGSMHIDTRDDAWPTVFDLRVSRVALADLSWLDERLDHGTAAGAVAHPGRRGGRRCRCAGCTGRPARWRIRRLGGSVRDPGGDSIPLTSRSARQAGNGRVGALAAGHASRDRAAVGRCGVRWGAGAVGG